VPELLVGEGTHSIQPAHGGGGDEEILEKTHAVKALPEIALAVSLHPHQSVT